MRGFAPSGMSTCGCRSVASDVSTASRSALHRDVGLPVAQVAGHRRRQGLERRRVAGAREQVEERRLGEPEAALVVERRPQLLRLRLATVVGVVLAVDVPVVPAPSSSTLTRSDKATKVSMTTMPSQTLVHRPDQRPGIVRRQVIEQARADDDVEHAVLGDRQVANVVLVEHGAAEAERVTREVALGDARGAAFDADDLAAVSGELEGVVPLEAGQVQNPALRQRLADDVAADLQDSLEAVIDRGLARVGAAGQLDRHRRPGTVLDRRRP